MIQWSSLSNLRGKKIYKNSNMKNHSHFSGLYGTGTGTQHLCFTPELLWTSGGGALLDGRAAMDGEHLDAQLPQEVEEGLLAALGAHPQPPRIHSADARNISSG
jgi:hypothetical protein